MIQDDMSTIKHSGVGIARTLTNRKTVKLAADAQSRAATTMTKKEF